MKEHYDIDNKKLKEGTIYRSNRSKTIYAFTGKYNKNDEARFENIDGEVIELAEEFSLLLKKLSRREIEKKIRWLEKGLED